MRKNTIRFIIIVVTLVYPLIPTAMAQPPMPPCWFYGTATVDGLPAPDNLNISAVISGSNLTWTTRTKNGTYGWVQRGSTSFHIPYDNMTSPNKDGGVDSDTIEFYFNGTKTNETATFESLTMKRVDLVVGSPEVNGRDEVTLILLLCGALAIVIGIALGAILWIRRKACAQSGESGIKTKEDVKNLE